LFFKNHVAAGEGKGKNNPIPISVLFKCFDKGTLGQPGTVEIKTAFIVFA
jgi:hypothetical protein